MHEFMPVEPFLIFLQQTCPFHYFRSKTHVFGWFRAILLPHLTRCENLYRGAFNGRVYASETISCLVTANMLNPQL